MEREGRGGGPGWGFNWSAGLCVLQRESPAPSLEGCAFYPALLLPPTPLQGQGQGQAEGGGRTPAGAGHALWTHPQASWKRPCVAALVKVLPGLVSGSSGDSWPSSCPGGHPGEAPHPYCVSLPASRTGVLPGLWKPYLVAHPTPTPALL